MTITSEPEILDITTVGNPTYVATGGATATFSAPTLVSPDNDISGAGDPVIYEWIATVTPGADIGSITFTVNSSIGEEATANSVIVSPPLTYAVTVNADPPGVIENTAVINESGATIDNEPSNKTQTLTEPTLAVITAVRSRIEDGVAVISWDVSLEIDTVGYDLERWADGAWARVNAELIPALLFTPGTKTYEQADPGATLGTTQRYRIVELDGQGRWLPYGPYDLELDGGEISYATWAAVIDWGGADASPGADPDGDGLTNWQEYLAGTDPLNANSVLRIVALRDVPPAGMAITWQSVLNKVYVLEISTDLRDGFTPFAADIPATPPLNTHTVAVDRAGGPLYFRVIVQ